MALIYSSLGSQGAVARALGISHQRVGRVLRMGYPELGGLKDETRISQDAGFMARLELGYQDHVERVQARAQADGIPVGNPPIFVRRMIDAEGRPAPRLIAPHLHWISDELRARWVANLARTRQFYAAFVGSIVNLEQYLRARLARPATAEGRQRAKESRDSIRAAIARGIEQSAMWSRPIPMEFGKAMLDQLMREALAKHERAIGDPGTVRGAKVMLQFNSLRPKPKTKKTGKGKTKGKRNAPASARKAAGKGRRT